jgi:hypothetical protein
MITANPCMACTAKPNTGVDYYTASGCFAGMAA